MSTTTIIVPIECERAYPTLYPTVCVPFPTWGVDKWGNVYRWKMTDPGIAAGRPERTGEKIKLGETQREIFRGLEVARAAGESGAEKAWLEYAELVLELRYYLRGAVK